MILSILLTKATPYEYNNTSIHVHIYSYMYIFTHICTYFHTHVYAHTHVETLTAYILSCLIKKKSRFQPYIHEYKCIFKCLHTYIRRNSHSLPTVIHGERNLVVRNSHTHTNMSTFAYYIYTRQNSRSLHTKRA